MTALIDAAKNGNINIVEALLAKGAEFKGVKIQGDPILVWAAKNRYSDIVKVLLKKGAKSVYFHEQDCLKMQKMAFWRSTLER